MCLKFAPASTLARRAGCAGGAVDLRLRWPLGAQRRPGGAAECVQLPVARPLIVHPDAGKVRAPLGVSKASDVIHIPLWGVSGSP